MNPEGTRNGILYLPKIWPRLTWYLMETVKMLHGVVPAWENVTNAELFHETFALTGSCNGTSDIGGFVSSSSCVTSTLQQTFRSYPSSLLGSEPVFEWCIVTLPDRGELKTQKKDRAQECQVVDRTQVRQVSK